jgi:hypothetical protein
VAEFLRDRALEEAMLAAVIGDRTDDPRSKQRQVGPSSVGFCRELLRGALFEPDAQLEPESHWALAAHVGTAMGADLERIFGNRLGAIEQQRITTTFTELGMPISGAMDLVFMKANQISDLKSITDMGGIISDLNADAAKIERLLAIKERGRLYDEWEPVIGRDGEEIYDEAGRPVMREQTDDLLKWMNKLSNYVQISIYVVGAMQAGILERDATGRLVFYDRAGDYQEFVAIIVTPEMIDLFFAIAQHRIRQVVEAQRALEQSGSAFLIHDLRDKSPSFCFSPKVMCPRRMLCWGGSDWAPSQTEIVDPEFVRATEHYVEGARLEKMGKGMKESARSLLRGDGTGATRIQGTTPDGVMVSWVRGGTTINVVQTAGKPDAKPE